MGELSRLSELTRFAELTRFLLLFPIISTLRLHGKRVVPLRRDPGWRLPSYSLRRDRNSHVIVFCRVVPAERVEKSRTRAFNLYNVNKYQVRFPGNDAEMLISYLTDVLLTFRRCIFTIYKPETIKTFFGQMSNAVRTNIIILLLWQVQNTKYRPL